MFLLSECQVADQGTGPDAEDPVVDLVVCRASTSVQDMELFLYGILSRETSTLVPFSTYAAPDRRYLLVLFPPFAGCGRVGSRSSGN